MYHARVLLHIEISLFPFPDLFSPSLLICICFSFLKTGRVWFCLNLVISAFQFELVLSFRHKLYESFTKFPSHSLMILLPGNSFCFLSIMLVAYNISRLSYALFLSYFRSFVAFPLFLLSENETCMVLSKLCYFRCLI